MGSDGWEYDSIADKLLERHASSLHNFQRRQNEQSMLENMVTKTWSNELWKAASRSTFFQGLVK